jgi:xylose isomerase
LQAALLKADAAFAFMERLGLPFFCFHDRDVVPEGDRPRQSNAILDQVLERIEGDS